MSHGNDPPVERIDLGEGQWWDIYTVVTRRMRKAFRGAGMSAFIRGLGNGVQADWTDPEALRKLVVAHPDAWDLGAVDDAYLLNGTHAWSFLEREEMPPITLDFIESLPAALVDKVLARMRELYAEPTEETIKK